MKQFSYRVSGFLLALLMVEGLLQLAALASPPVALLLSPGIPRRLPDDRLGRRPNPALPGHDAEGWRNPVALSQADVVALGDSQTYGDEVALENAWPLVVGEVLGVSAYNMGLSGYGPVAYYLLAREAIERQPKILLVGIYAGNDFVDAYAEAALSERAPELLVDAPTSLEVVRETEASRESLSAAWSRARAARRGSWKTLRDRYLGPFERNSKLWGLVRGIENILKKKSPGPRGDSLRTDFDKYQRKVEDLPRDDFFPLRGPASASVLTPAGRVAAVDIEDPRIQLGVHVTLQALAGIRAECNARCQVVAVLIPTKELVFEEQVAASGVRPPESYAELLAREKALWTQVRRGLEARSIPFVDVLPDLRTSANAGRNPYLSDWDGHPNVQGNEVIARSISRHPIFRDFVGP